MAPFGETGCAQKIWLSALVAGGRGVTAPLAVTRETLKEDVQWGKERVA